MDCHGLSKIQNLGTPPKFYLYCTLRGKRIWSRMNSLDLLRLICSIFPPGNPTDLGNLQGIYLGLCCGFSKSQKTSQGRMGFSPQISPMDVQDLSLANSLDALFENCWTPEHDQQCLGDDPAAAHRCFLVWWGLGCGGSQRWKPKTKEWSIHGYGMIWIDMAEDPLCHIFASRQTGDVKCDVMTPDIWVRDQNRLIA